MTKYRYVIVDTETGGVDPIHSALLSISAVDSETNDAFSSFIRAEPGLELNPGALAANGFTQDECTSISRPTENSVMKDFAKWLAARPAYVVCGCNVKFDIDFVNAAFNRQKIRAILPYRYVDVQGMAILAEELGLIELPRAKDGIMPSVRLDSLTKLLQKAREKSTHNSDEDVELTFEVFKFLIKKFNK